MRNTPNILHRKIPPYADKILNLFEKKIKSKYVSKYSALKLIPK